MKKLKKFGILKDTLITLGCFSECFDDNNKSETLKLIQYFLKRGNQVQVSTKRELKVEDFFHFKSSIQYLGQLLLFISSATISQWSTIEKGTIEPNKRFNSFEISKKLNIPTVLYMKPVIKEITIKDIDLYKEVINKYNIRDVVIGSMLGEKQSQETAHFSNERLLFYNPISDELQIKKKLMQMRDVRVFSRSSQVAKYYKENI